MQVSPSCLMIYAHLSEPPPPVTSRRAHLPSAVDQVVARALAKAPTDRYSSCQEFTDALLQTLGTIPPASHLPASGRPALEHPPTQVNSVSDGPGQRRMKPAPGPHQAKPRRWPQRLGIAALALAALLTLMETSVAYFVALIRGQTSNAPGHDALAAGFLTLLIVLAWTWVRLYRRRRRG
jgi:hypothetical protein